MSTAAAASAVCISCVPKILPRLLLQNTQVVRELPFLAQGWPEDQEVVLNR